MQVVTNVLNTIYAPGVLKVYVYPDLAVFTRTVEFIFWRQVSNVQYVSIDL